MSEPPALERLLRRDRTITAIGLAVLCLLAWLYIVAGAGMGGGAWEMTRLSLFPHQAADPHAGMDMSGMDMSGMDMSGMSMSGTAAWSPALWALTIAMWWTMMVAMMAPSAAPAILLYGRVYRGAVAEGRHQRLAPTWAFAAGYLLVWLGFSLAAALLHWGLERVGLVSAATMGSASRWLSGGVLIAAGVYQLSSLHNVCLSHCRSPASFLTREWRPGLSGALRLGVLHGAYCLGCCWMVMLLLFVGGVMNLAWIAAITLLVLAEKLAPGGPWIGRIMAAVLIAWGVVTLWV